MWFFILATETMHLKLMAEKLFPLHFLWTFNTVNSCFYEPFVTLKKVYNWKTKMQLNLSYYHRITFGTTELLRNNSNKRGS